MNDFIDGLSRIMQILSPFILGLLAYLTVQANARAQTTARAQEISATEAKAAAEDVKTAAKDTARAAATAVSEVKQTLVDTTSATAEQLKGLAVTADSNQRMGIAIHTLVNSDMSRQLHITWLALQRVADMTKDPEDIRVAVEAKQLYDSHQSRQSVVDAAPAIDLVPNQGVPPK